MKLPTTDKLETELGSYRTGFQQFLLALLFGGLLSIALLDHSQYLVAWIAFVPLLLAIENATLARTYTIGLLGGLCLSITGSYWVMDFISIAKGFEFGSSLLLALVSWGYFAHLIALPLVLFQWLKKHSGIHVFLLFPLIVTSFMAAFPMLFPVHLGDSQINFTSALQGTEFFGVYGLDAIIALANIVIFRFVQLTLNRGLLNRHEPRSPWAIAILLFVAWFVYGANSFSAWEQKSAAWATLRVGIVQPNEIPRLGKKIAYPGYSSAFLPEMDMTERLGSLGAEIIIWPEAQKKGYLDEQNVSDAYHRSIRALGSSLLFQDTSHIRDPINGKPKAQLNTAILLDDSGHQIGRYEKMKRIPFGEYVPLFTDGSLAKKWIKGLFGEFLTEVSAGKSHQLFKHEKTNLIPLICYETTLPVFVANAINNTAELANKSNGSLLIGLSNDGWFGSTHQPYQHIMSSAIRAVENRIPLVHVANNGPSIVVNPSGKIIFSTDFQRAGGYLADVPYSHTAQGSFYSRHPNMFINCVYLMTLFIILYTIFTLFSRRREW